MSVYIPQDEPGKPMDLPPSGPATTQNKLGLSDAAKAAEKKAEDAAFAALLHQPNAEDGRVPAWYNGHVLRVAYDETVCQSTATIVTVTKSSRSRQRSMLKNSPNLTSFATALCKICLFRPIFEQSMRSIWPSAKVRNAPENRDTICSLTLSILT